LAVTGNYLIPYDGAGNLREYAGGYSETEWRDNTPFPAELQVVGYERGRTAVRVIWEDGDGHAYPMFISYLVELIRTSNVIDGKVSGTWMGTKKGQNYGLRMVGA
jgi:hypothetical protein